MRSKIAFVELVSVSPNIDIFTLSDHNILNKYVDSAYCLVCMCAVAPSGTFLKNKNFEVYYLFKCLGYIEKC